MEVFFWGGANILSERSGGVRSFGGVCILDDAIGIQVRAVGMRQVLDDFNLVPENLPRKEDEEEAINKVEEAEWGRVYGDVIVSTRIFSVDAKTMDAIKDEDLEI